MAENVPPLRGILTEKDPYLGIFPQRFCYIESNFMPNCEEKNLKMGPMFKDFLKKWDPVKWYIPVYLLNTSPPPYAQKT